MSAASSEFRRLLLQARDGDESAFGRLLDMFRNALHSSAERELGRRVRVRADASDVVQQTMLSAIKKRDDFAGNDKAAFIAWLQQIQSHNIKDELRKHVHAERRSVKREVTIENSEFALNEIPANGQQTPERQAADDEKFSRLRDAVTCLPPDQCVAVRMRHLEGRTLEDIAKAMGKTKMAVASLITRGLKNLRGRIAPEDQQDDR